MTLGELLDQLHDILQDGAPADTDLIRMLNRCNQTTARELEIPQYYAEINGVTDEFTLPDDAHGSPSSIGLLEVRLDNSVGIKLDILTTGEADARYPGWKNWSVGKTLFIVFDPAKIGLTNTVRPVPLPDSADPQDFYATWIVKPPDMADLTDEPWDGAMAEFHHLLIHYVAYEVLLRTNDQRRGEHYSLYTGLMSEAYNATNPSPIMPTNVMWNKMGYAIDD